jgi:hypothetical protein
MTIREYDCVVLIADFPEKGLKQGDVGAVVMVYSPTDYEVEFIDKDGQPTRVTLPM